MMEPCTGDTGEQLYTAWSGSAVLSQASEVGHVATATDRDARFANNASGGVQYSLEPVSCRLASASQCYIVA